MTLKEALFTCFKEAKEFGDPDLISIKLFLQDVFGRMNDNRKYQDESLFVYRYNQWLRKNKMSVYE